jgi:ribose 5-phosphate isomerase B
MKIAVGSDERTLLTDAVVAELMAKGMSVELMGALGEGADPAWPEVGRSVAERVSSGEADQGILFCWTGTGVSIAANKVPGVRAALCTDASTASGARQWNHANVLVMGLRLTSPEVALEMLNAWFSTPPGDGEKAELVDRLEAIDKSYRLADRNST